MARENALTLPDTPEQIKTEASAPAALHGSVMVLIQFDVCEEIRLDRLREIFSARTVEQPSFKHPAPGYVRFQRPPVVEPVEPLVLESGERLDGQIKYYDYGVLSVIFELPFSGDWDRLVRLAGRWVWDTDFTSFAQKIVRQKLDRARPALVKPYEDWLHEDYFVFHVREVAGNLAHVEDEIVFVQPVFVGLDQGGAGAVELLPDDFLREAGKVGVPDPAAGQADEPIPVAGEGEFEDHAEDAVV